MKGIRIPTGDTAGNLPTLARMIDENALLATALSMPVDEDFIRRERIDRRREQQIREAALDQALVIGAALMTLAIASGAEKSS